MTADFDSSAAHDDGVQTLPTDAQQVYHALARDGAAWRVGAASEIERLNTHLQARIAQMSEAFEAETMPEPVADTLVTVAAPQDTPARSTFAHRAPQRLVRARGWMATLATAAVVIAFLTVYALSVTHRPTGSSKQAGVNGVTGAGGASSVHNTITPHDFVSLSKLDYSAEFDANNVPAVAPSDPRVVYETMSSGLQQHQAATIRATSDGGATWRELAVPVPAQNIGHLSIGVSPTNAQTVFLMVDDMSTIDCPANRLMPSEGSFSFCQLQYTSLNGGATWHETILPLANGTMPGILEASMNPGLVGVGNSVLAQGSRLYANYVCAKFSDNCSRLVTSKDGGLSWAFADAQLQASSGGILCDYTRSPTGATLFAVMSSSCAYNAPQPTSLWRSDDGGRSWAEVSQLPTTNERGIRLTQNAATGASVLYLASPRTSQMPTNKMGNAFPVFSQSPADVYASVDGGKTWQSAPTAGIPAEDAVFLQMGLLGTLRDGSVIVDVITSDRNGSIYADNFSGSGLYIWRVGDTTWRQIGSVPREIDGLVIAPWQQGTGDSLYAVLVTRQNTGTFAFIEADVAQ